MISTYEATHTTIEKDEDGLYWVVRDEETQQEYGNRIVCEAFTRSEDETHEDMLNNGYLHYATINGEMFYIQDLTVNA